MLSFFQSTRIRGWASELLFNLYTYRFKLITLLSTTMKIIKEIMVGAVLLIVCQNLRASTLTKRTDLSKYKAVNTYINAIVHGRPNGIIDAIDDDAFFNIQHGDRVNVAYKPQLLYALRSTENIEQKCKYSKNILWEDENISIQKLSMKFPDFTRTDVITLQHAGSGWKITKVETSFK